MRLLSDATPPSRLARSLGAAIGAVTLLVLVTGCAAPSTKPVPSAEEIADRYLRERAAREEANDRILAADRAKIESFGFAFWTLPNPWEIDDRYMEPDDIEAWHETSNAPIERRALEFHLPRPGYLVTLDEKDVYRYRIREDCLELIRSQSNFVIRGEGEKSFSGLRDLLEEVDHSEPAEILRLLRPEDGVWRSEWIDIDGVSRNWLEARADSKGRLVTLETRGKTSFPAPPSGWAWCKYEFEDGELHTVRFRAEYTHSERHAYGRRLRTDVDGEGVARYERGLLREIEYDNFDYREATHEAYEYDGERLKRITTTYPNDEGEINKVMYELVWIDDEYRALVHTREDRSTELELQLEYDWTSLGGAKSVLKSRIEKSKWKGATFCITRVSESLTPHMHAAEIADILEIIPVDEQIPDDLYQAAAPLARAADASELGTQGRFAAAEIHFRAGELDAASRMIDLALDGITDAETRAPMEALRERIASLR